MSGVNILFHSGKRAVSNTNVSAVVYPVFEKSLNWLQTKFIWSAVIKIIKPYKNGNACDAFLRGAST